MTSDIGSRVESMSEEEYREWRVSLVEEQMRLKCLDPQLYDILIMLNNKEYYTCDSCAGHSAGSRGSITFISHEMSRTEYHCFVEGIYYLLQQAGLKDIQITKFNRDRGNCPKIEATFEAIGSQYRPFDYILSGCPQDQLADEFDFGHRLPLRPERCEKCGKSDFWIQGDVYGRRDRIHWRCMYCQPR